ncbi:MAG: acetate kinase, partial [Bacteroidia bacterium]
FIGAYIAAINGCDLLVFTGGIGENDFNLRKLICSGMESLGLLFDEEANDNKKGIDLVISKPESRIKVMIVTTDEEVVIASDTKTLVSSIL